MYRNYRSSRNWRGRGLGFGWLFAFGLGYALRDLQEPDSQVRKFIDAVSSRFNNTSNLKNEPPVDEEKQSDKEEE